MRNSKFLKKILTTASIGAFALCASPEANAAAGVNLSTLHNAPVISIADLVRTNANNWAIFNAPGQTLNLTGGTQLVGAFMSRPGIINVIQSATISAVSNSPDGGLATINVYNGQTLTFGDGGGYGDDHGRWPGTIAGGGNYDGSGVGSIILGNSIKGDAAELSITVNGGTPTFYFALDSFPGAENPGILNSSGSFLYNGPIGASNPLSAINVTNNNAASWFANVVNATNINLMSNTSVVRFDGGSNVTANVVNQSGDVGTTAINVTGGSSFTGNIGVGTGIAGINIDDEVNFTVNGNINNAPTKLTNDAQLTLIGGVGEVPNNFNSTINGTVVAHGVIAVGAEGQLGNVNFGGIIGATKAPKLLQLVGMDGGDGSMASLTDNATFDGTGAAAGEAGINLGPNTKLNVGSPNTPIVLTLSNGATIEGSGPAHDNDGIGGGSLAIFSANVPGIVGANNRLLYVQMDAFSTGGAAAFDSQVYADVIDLTNGSKLILNVNAITNNGTAATSIVSTDYVGMHNLGHPPVSTVYYNGNGDNNLAIGVVSGTAVNIGGTGTLTSPSVSSPSVMFNANGTLNINNKGGVIEALNSNGAGVGSFNVTFEDNMQEEDNFLHFTGEIGDGPNNSLNSFGIVGPNPMNMGTNSSDYNANIHIDTSDIYAHNITYRNIVLNIADDVTVHSQNYIMQNVILNAGSSSLNISGGSVSLNDNIVINAEYNENGQIAVNLPTNVTGRPNLILNITGYANPNMPVEGGSTMTFINIPQSLYSRVSTNIATIATPPYGSYGSWELFSPGVIKFYPPVSFSLSARASNISNSQEFSNVPAGVDPEVFAGLVKSYANNLAIPPSGFGNNNITTIAYISAVQNFTRQNLNITLPETTSIAVLEGMANMGQINSLLANIATTGTMGASLESDFATMAITNPADANDAFNRLQTVGTTVSSTVDAIANSVNARGLNTLLPVSYVPDIAPPTGVSITAPTSSGDITPQLGGAALPISESADVEVEIPGENLQAEAYGIAAGSSPYDKFGVWGSINAGTANQKMRKGNAGFKSFTEGFAVGVDTLINDQVTVGYLVSYSLNHIKHKDQNVGNKTDSSSWIGSLYGNYQFNNNWFVRGTGIFNRTRINDKVLIPTPRGKGIAQAKYNLISYGADASVGFTHKFTNQLTVTPTLGLRIIHSNKISYSQYGSTNQNTTNITQGSMNNYSGLAGISVAKTFVKNDISITPEVHANFQYGFNIKSPTGSYVSPLNPNQVTTFIGTKAVALTSAYGSTLTGKNDMIEVGITGDINVASKYIGYQGSLKLKINF